MRSGAGREISGARHHSYERTGFSLVGLGFESSVECELEGTGGEVTLAAENAIPENA